jgi:hypothetical protein
MTLDAARPLIGHAICNTVGIQKAAGRYLPPGSTFHLESVNAGSFVISWPSPRGKMEMQLSTADLTYFVSQAVWFSR